MDSLIYSLRGMIGISNQESVPTVEGIGWRGAESVGVGSTGGIVYREKGSEEGWADEEEELVQ